MKCGNAWETTITINQYERVSRFRAETIADDAGFVTINGRLYAQEYDTEVVYVDSDGAVFRRHVYEDSISLSSSSVTLQVYISNYGGNDCKNGGGTITFYYD